jgi:hypothetical protein
MSVCPGCAFGHRTAAIALEKYGRELSKEEFPVTFSVLPGLVARYVAAQEVDERTGDKECLETLAAEFVQVIDSVTSLAKI